MPVQCNICLLADTDTEWSVLNSCGHVFHTVCLQQELEYRRRCPNCRVDVPKCRGNSQPFRKVFFELSDDLGSSQRGTHGSGGDGGRDAGVDVSVGQLQMKLLVKEQQLQQVKIECKESSERIITLEAQAQELEKTVRKLQESKDSKIGEIKQLGRQNKQLLNENANLRVELNRAQTVEARVTLAMDSTLAGDALQHQLMKLVQQDVSVPGWFPNMLEVRNKQLSAQTNKLQRLAQEKEQAEGPLRHAEHEKQRLREQVSKLKEDLEDLKQQQQAAARSLSAAAPNMARQQQQQQPEGLREGADGDFVLLEGSEEQQQPWGPDLGSECHPAGAADEGSGWPDDPGGGYYSEVDSEEELEIVEEGSGHQQQQQQERCLGTAGQRHDVLQGGEQGQAAQPCAGSGSLGGPLLGKRRSPDRLLHQDQQQHQQQQPRASSSGQARGALQPCNWTGYQPLPLKAGPSRLGAGPGTGPSFLRDPQRASTGLEDGSKYIHRGPDGKGGSVSVFKAGAAASTQHKVLQAAGASKKQKSKLAGGAAKGAAANGGCTIDLFFNRANN